MRPDFPGPAEKPGHRRQTVVAQCSLFPVFCRRARYFAFLLQGCCPGKLLGQPPSAGSPSLKRKQLPVSVKRTDACHRQTPPATPGTVSRPVILSLDQKSSAIGSSPRYGYRVALSLPSGDRIFRHRVQRAAAARARSPVTGVRFFVFARIRIAIDLYAVDLPVFDQLYESGKGHFLRR